MIIGFMLFFVMRAMGELLLSNLEYKSFSDFASDLLGPWAGYFTGWTYWFCWVVTGMADVVAITAYAQFWFPGLSDWVASLSVIILLLVLNLATVKMFGEMEFWFALIKVLAIVTFLVVGTVFLGSGQPLDGNATGFHLITDNGGFFPPRFAACAGVDSGRSVLLLPPLKWWVQRPENVKIRRPWCLKRLTV